MKTPGKFVMIVLLLAVSLNLSGCWDQIELDQIALVMLMGIDTNPIGDGFEVTVHVLNTAGDGKKAQEGSSGSSGGSQTLTMSCRGQTVMDATRNLRGRIGGQFSFHHVRVILIGEDLARKGIDPVLDFLFRAPEIRFTNYLLVCQGSAKEIMTLAPELAGTLDEELRGVINNQEEWSKGYAPRLTEFYTSYLDQSAQPIAGRVFTIKPDTPLQPEGQGGQEQTGTGDSVTVEGLAVFRDAQLAGWLTGTETIGYRYITGQGGTMILVVPWRAGLAALEVTPDSQSMEYVPGSNPPHFRVHIKTSGILVEYTGKIKFTNQNVSELQALAGDTLRELMINTDKKAKELKSDFLGYGSTISRQDPKAWQTLNKKWRETFPAVSTEFNIQLNIKHTGPILTPPVR